MNNKNIILIIIIGALTLALIGYFTVNPIKFKKANKDNGERFTDIFFGEENSEDYNLVTYNIKITNEKTDNENENKINYNINFKKNDEEQGYNSYLLFNKETGELLNEIELGLIENLEVKEIVNGIVDKCKNEKLYLVDSLSMSYYTNSVSTK